MNTTARMASKLPRSVLSRIPGVECVVEGVRASAVAAPGAGRVIYSARFRGGRVLPFRRGDVRELVERALAGRVASQVFRSSQARAWYAVAHLPADGWVSEDVTDALLCQAGRPDLYHALERCDV
jgi:hypothetical protein